MASAAFLSVTLVPALMVVFIRGKIASENQSTLNRILHKIYRPIIRWVLNAKIKTIIIALIVMIITIFPASKLGSEFMPTLNEGALLYMPTMLPGLSITKSAELLQKQDRIIKSFPEVKWVYGKAGRASTATDPAPLEMFETTIILQPEEQWRSGVTIDKLVSEMDRALQFPGVSNAWTMPIRSRIDMLATGIKIPLGVKVFGQDLNQLEILAHSIERVIKKVPGSSSVYAERLSDGYYLDIIPNQSALARYGLTIDDVQSTLASAIGGEIITTTVEGRERYGINIRYPRNYRSSPAAIMGEVLISLPKGGTIPLGEIAKVDLTKGPSSLRTEDGQLSVYIYIDVRDRDLGGFVKEARNAVAAEIKLPAGYYISWSGQFEYLERAEAKMRLVVPATLLIIFGLLYANLRSLSDAIIVMLSLPFALVGGVWLMWIMKLNMSVAAGVGFIGLVGVAAETGIVMLLYLNSAMREVSDNSSKSGKLITKQDIHYAVIKGAVERVRPKIMTVVAVMAGLIPILWSKGPGSQMMQLIAVPMIGGMLSSTISTLVVIPVIYALVKGYSYDQYFYFRK